MKNLNNKAVTVMSLILQKSNKKWQNKRYTRLPCKLLRNHYLSSNIDKN